MRRIGYGHKSSILPARDDSIRDRGDVDTAGNRVLDALKNRDGAVSILVLGLFFMAMIIFFTVILSYGFGGRKLAVTTHDWLGQSMEYASSAAAVSSTDTKLDESTARAAFVDSFAEMTGTSFSGTNFRPGSKSPYNGPVELKEFDAVYHGEPGYVARIGVPVLSVKIPFLESKQTVIVTLEYFAVGKTTEL